MGDIQNQWQIQDAPQAKGMAQKKTESVGGKS